MGKRLNSVKKNNPTAAGRDEVQEIAGDIDTYAALAAVATTEGGALLLDALYRDIASAVHGLVNGYRTLSDVELRALCANLEARMGVARTLKNAKTNLELAEEVLEQLTT